MKEVIALFSQYLANNKFILFCFIAMLVCLFCLRELSMSRGRKLMWYSLLVGGMLICPVTAKIFMMYQTKFYTYQWIWSFIPAAAVSAWFFCEVLWKEKSKRWILWPSLLALLFCMGNQGGVVTKTTQDVEWEEECREMLRSIGEETFSEGLLLAPREVMEYARKASGKIKVLYGRSMWEAEAAAYDYEIHSNELIAVYEWMESMKEESFKPEVEETFFGNVLSYPIKVLVLPVGAAKELEVQLKEVLKEGNLAIENEWQAGSYYVYVLER